MEQLKGFISREATEGGINRRTVYSTEYKVVVDTANVWYIQKDGGGHSYTFEAFDLEGRYGREGDLKNVVLNYESRDGSYSKYVVSYNITEDDLFKWERGSGSINFPESTTFFNVGTSENPNGFTLNDPDCWETIVVGQVAIPCASGMHQPGMTGCIYEGTSQAAVVQDVTIQVISVGCGSNAGIGGTPGNGSGPGSGGTNPGNGNNNGNNNGGNNNPGDDNPGHNNPGFSDKDGDPIITKPVKTLEPEEEEPEEPEDDCQALNNLKEDDNANILPIVQELRNKTGEKKEYFSSFKRSVNFAGDMEYANTGVQQGGFGSAGGMSGSVWYGQIHTHHKNTQPMFSWSDLYTLKEMYENTYSTNKPLVFIAIVCHNAGIYSLKINDWNAFLQKINDGLSAVPENNIKDKLDKLDKRMKNIYGNTYGGDIEKIFLQQFKDYGVSLYKAEDDNLSNWKELKLNNPEASNPTVVSTPCN